jgi:hypothetical protein
MRGWHRYRPDGRALLACLATLVVAAITLWDGTRYSMGELRRMGPGYFPVVLGVTLAGLGLLVLLERPALAEPDEAERPALRPILSLLAGLLAFALLVERFGLLPATFALVLIAAAAEPGLRPKQMLALAAVVSLAAVAIFVLALGLPLRPIIWPAG